uniref:HrpF n=1 Tax=Pseudomonas syringae pv. tomato TaxID=323 RepID=O87439_PSEUB|nr:HrpF [Pseudomonas syringae pv. tomato]
MISFNSLQRHLDNSVSRAHTNMDQAAMEASESGTVEDLQAFTMSQQQVDVAGIAVNECLRAKHGINKAVIDGIQ